MICGSYGESMLRRLACAVTLTLILGAQDSQPTSPPATTTLEGQVVDLRGDGVPLARITVTDRAQVALARGICDGEGYFKLARVPVRPTWTITANAPQYSIGHETISGEATPVRIRVHEAATLRGDLRDREGKAVAGVVVRAEYLGRALFGNDADATTDAEGHFVLDAVALGHVRVTAWVPGQGLAETYRVVEGDAEVPLRPASGPTTAMSITVEGLPEGKGDAIVGSLAFHANGRGLRLPPPLDSIHFAPDGTWHGDALPDLPGVVYLWAPDCTIKPPQVRIEAGKGPHVLRFHATAALAKTRQWPARVRDAAGLPVAGVRFSLQAGLLPARSSATSGADGTLEFVTELPAGTDAFVRSLDPAWVLDQKNVESVIGIHDHERQAWHACKLDTARPLDLRVVPACSVSGQVLREDGSPAPFARFSIAAENLHQGEHWTTIVHGLTDRGGNFALGRLHHVDSTLHLEVGDTQGSLKSKEFKLATPGTLVQLGELRLVAPARIEGVVRDEKGKPRPGVGVRCFEWDFATSRGGSGNMLEVVTDRSGRYRFASVPAGGAFLQVVFGDSYPLRENVEPFEVEAGRTIVKDLEVPRR